mgnify:CR=1 FL=1
MTSVPPVNDVDLVEILDLDRLLVLMVLAMGLAMVLGNGYAIWQHHRGNKPKGEEGEFRGPRAYWLVGVGLVMTAWGLLSL